MAQLPTKAKSEETTKPEVERRETKTIEISTAKIEVPITTNRPELYESNHLHLKLTRAQTNAVYGILYALQLSGEKMLDNSAPRLPVDAVRWMIDKIGDQFEKSKQIEI